MRTLLMIMAAVLLNPLSVLSWVGPYQIWNDGNPKTIEGVSDLMIIHGLPTVILASWEPVPPEDPYLPAQFLSSCWNGGGWPEPDSLHVPLKAYSGGHPLLDSEERLWFLWYQGTGQAHEPAYLLASYLDGDSWSEPAVVYEITPGIEVVGGGDGMAFTSDSSGRIWWVMEHRWLNQVLDDSYHICAFVYEDGEWTGPHLIADSQEDDMGPAAGADDRGGIWVAWMRENRNGGRSLISRYLTGYLWSEEMEVPLPDSSSLNEKPFSLTVDSHNDPWLAFILHYRDDTVASVSKYSEGEGWNSPWILGTHAYSDTLDIGVRIESGRNREVWLAWITRPLQSWFAFSGRILLRRYSGQWSAPEVIASDFQNDIPRIIVEESNRVWLTWSHETTPGTPGEMTTTWYTYRDVPTSIDEHPSGNRLPAAVTLSQNHPNPFNPQTEITFELPEGVEEARLIIYDSRGRRVKIVSITGASPGSHPVTWDGRDDEGRRVQSGIYFYRLVAGGESITRKMVLAE